MNHRYKARIMTAALALGVIDAASPARSQPVETKKMSAAELHHRTVHRRAIETVIWGMPAVNFQLMYQAMVRETGGQYNQILYWSRLLDWKNQTLTPNPDVIYVMPFFNTQEVGPVVLEIPPADNGAINGSVMDLWQAALEDVGPAGADQGKGGKYLILPPGYSMRDVPEGYIPLPSRTYRGYALLRSVLRGGSDSDIAQAVAYAKRIKLYPLSQAAHPPRTTFVDAADRLFDASIPYDIRFFRALDQIVQQEPWIDRDRGFIDMLRTVGIERGKPFDPDTATQAVLGEAIEEAHLWIDDRYQALLQPYFGKDNHWSLPGAAPLMQSVTNDFNLPDAYPVDLRGVTYSFAFFSPRRQGKGQFYLLTLKDRDGQPLDGKSTYRLRVPVGVPVSQYWSATAYNRETHTFIRDMAWPGRSSQTLGLRTNADGSVDLYFGPTPPPNSGVNWIPTNPKENFEIIFRMFGPQKPIFEKTWTLGNVEKIQ